MLQDMTFTINGTEHQIQADPSMRLLDLLRDGLHMTGTKEGCSEGECGACTVLIDGEPVNSCLMLAGQAESHAILTIEGISVDGAMSRLQDAFIQAGAVQCGFCTPGMIMVSKSLLIKNPHPSDEEIKVALSGNLCRCTGYKKIIDAVRLAQETEK